MTRALYPGRFAFASLLAALAGGCASFREEVPTLPPIVIGNSAVATPLPARVSGQLPAPTPGIGGGSFPVDPALVGGIGTASEIAVLSQRNIAQIPAISINWSEVKDLPVDRRTDFLRNLDVTLRQLQTAEINARLTLPKPGMEAAHAQTVKSFEEAVASLNRQRQELEVTPPERWEFAKENLHETWLDTQSAYVRAAATGN